MSDQATADPVILSIRAKAAQRDLIDQAASRQGRSRSDFMLEAATQRAEEVLLDQIYFRLDAGQMKAFADLMDKPPAVTDKLRRTLNTPTPWGQG